MADFTIERPVPFTVEGVDGDVYELPRLKNLDADQVEIVGGLAGLKQADRIRAIRKFLLAQGFRNDRKE